MGKKSQAKPQAEETAEMVYWGKGNAAPDKSEFNEYAIKAAFYRRLHALALSQEQDVKNAFESACREIMP